MGPDGAEISTPIPMLKMFAEVLVRPDAFFWEIDEGRSLLVVLLGYNNACLMYKHHMILIMQCAAQSKGDHFAVDICHACNLSLA